MWFHSLEMVTETFYVENNKINDKVMTTIAISVLVTSVRLFIS